MTGIPSRFVRYTIEMAETTSSMFPDILGRENLKAGTDPNGIYTGRFKRLSNPELISELHALLSQRIEYPVQLVHLRPLLFR